MFLSMDALGTTAPATLLNIAKIIHIYVFILFVFFSLLFQSTFDAFFDCHALVVEFVLSFTELMLFSFDSLMAIRAYL